MFSFIIWTISKKPYIYIYIVIGPLRYGLSKKFPGESSEVNDNCDVA